MKVWWALLGTISSAKDHCSCCSIAHGWNKSTGTWTVNHIHPHTDSTSCYTTGLCSSHTNLGVDSKINQLAHCSVQCPCAVHLVETFEYFWKLWLFIEWGENRRCHPLNRKCTKEQSNSFSILLRPTCFWHWIVLFSYPVLFSFLNLFVSSN